MIVKGGTLSEVVMTYYCGNGCNPNDNEVGTRFAFSDSVYRCNNWHLIRVAVKTNTQSNTWCRAAPRAHMKMRNSISLRLSRSNKLHSNIYITV
ncbi:xanthine dehydrogenase-like [Acipenser oxyrinchus oxyrinchus]|uniref:Xanthine dehydrogenase-like n=1 Tax=Acipenser oxyrinchus oxyrinchus TaxID=40147 RepID=A0AAD8GKX5_ACIOX|nr:xanthine dehydrogenase-like [Acipenser oxyrinchus oxyrinchus]